MTKIIGDTTSGLTLAQATELGIGLLPQIVIFGDKSYRDDTEIDSDTFVKMLEVSKDLPKTAAPPPVLYESLFEKLRETGEDALIITPSAQLSGTYRSALTARAEFPDLDIRVIDSQIIGCGDAMLLLEAKKMADDGIGLDEIEKQILDLVKRARFYAVVDTLEYLYKGGRIGGASKIFGDVLQIKPILLISDGRVEPFEKQRTKKRALARLVELIMQDCPKDKSQGLLSMSLQENLCRDELAYFTKEFKEKLGIDSVPFYNVPPAFMVHAGPGVVFVTFFVD